jgi:hypothetical protein
MAQILFWVLEEISEVQKLAFVAQRSRVVMRLCRIAKASFCTPKHS